MFAASASEAVGRLVREKLHAMGPWQTPMVGVGRSCVALSTLLTIAATPTETLFYRSPTFPDGFVCTEPVSIAVLPCHTGGAGYGGHLWRALFAVVLLLVASGWRPRLTAVPHWLVMFWFVNITPVPDGGEHLALVLTGLLLPLSLVDDRKWHWSWGRRAQSIQSRELVGWLCLAAVQLQTFAVYAHASVAKVQVAEWMDGTALWYWSRQVAFGFSDPIRPITDVLFANGYVVALVTYGALIIEALLVLAVVGGGGWRKVAYPVGLVFHLAIAMTMGLMSFFLSAAGLLTLAFAAPMASAMVRESRLDYDLVSRESAEPSSLTSIAAT